MKKITTFFTFLMLFSALVFAQSNPAGYAGAGTAANPYQIKTAQDLDNLRLYLKEPTTGDLTLHFKIMNDH